MPFGAEARQELVQQNQLAARRDEHLRQRGAAVGGLLRDCLRLHSFDEPRVVAHLPELHHDIHKRGHRLITSLPGDARELLYVLLKDCPVQHFLRLAHFDLDDGLLPGRQLA